MWSNVNKLWYLRSGKTSSLSTGPERDNGGLKEGNVHAHAICKAVFSPRALPTHKHSLSEQNLFLNLVAIWARRLGAQLSLA